MKKSLIALAALAATSAFAQSSVTLYGIVEAGVDIGYNRTQDSTSTINQFNAAGNGVSSTPNGATRIEQKNGMRVQDGNSQGTGTSRIGFRGTEDLGGGMKANFVLEMGLRLDDGAITNGGPGAASNATASSGPSGGNAFGRNAWGGVSGGFGEFRIGRQVLGSFGVQGSSAAAGSSNGLYESGMPGLLPIGGIRFSNAVRYLSPDMGGFKASIMLAAPETNSNGDPTVAMGTGATTNANTAPGVGGLTTTTTASRRTGLDLALEYANGPAYVGFGYNKRDTGNLTAITTPVVGITNVTTNAQTFAVSPSPFPTVIGSPATVTGYTLGGSYDLGVVKPFVNYTREKADFNSSSVFTAVNPALNSSTSSNGDSTARGFSVGLRAPVGAFTVIAGYGRVNTTSNTVVTNTAAGVTTVGRGTLQEKRDAFQLGAQYALSKRTLVQANYGYNKLRGNGSVVGTSTAVGAGRTETFGSGSDRITALNVGLKHSF